VQQYFLFIKPAYGFGCGKKEIPLVGCVPQSAEEKISGRLMCMKYKTNKKFLAAG